MSFLPGMTPLGAVQRVSQFPVIEGTVITGESAVGTAVAINLPAGIVAGELLLMFVKAGVTSISLPSGWTALWNTTYHGTDAFACFYKQATGSEGSTLMINTNGSIKRSYIGFRISGHKVAGGIMGAVATGNDKFPQPPSLTMAAGSKKYLWLATCAPIVGLALTITGHPASYPGVYLTPAEVLSVATKQLLAATDDPEGFTLSSTGGPWIAGTAAIEPII